MTLTIATDKNGKILKIYRFPDGPEINIDTLEKRHEAEAEGVNVYQVESDDLAKITNSEKIEHIEDIHEKLKDGKTITQLNAPEKKEKETKKTEEPEEDNA